MQVKVNYFTELKRTKDSAIFLGCGPSINSLSKENINYINNNFDTWTSNTFLINSELIPDFYHMEIKKHRNGPIVSRLSKERSKIYKNVKWIIDQTRPYILEHINLNDYSPNNFYIYKKTYRKDETGYYTPLDDCVSVSANASLTVIADIMVRMNYKKIYFLGVDMYDSKYFWSDNPKYHHITIEDIMKTVKPDERKPSDVNPTLHMKDYIPQFFKHNSQEVINLSNISAFKDTMKTQKISEVLK
jgi:hypothetical protein